jgi:hypothetical protein
MSEVVRRDRDLVASLRELYAGECQICGWAPRNRYGTELCEAHHVRWLSRGGDDALTNLVLVCPNRHRVIHRGDAPFDFECNAFVFATVTEALIQLEHSLEHPNWVTSIGIRLISLRLPCTSVGRRTALLARIL